MIYSKKGVSTIVANVLIVLLVIVGVAVIWAVVNPTLEKSAKGIEAADCFSVRLEPALCALTSGAIVKRNVGGSNAALTGVKLIFIDINGATHISTEPLSVGYLEELESIIYTSLTNPFPASGFVIGQGVKFNVAAVIDSAGNTIVCEALSQPVDCV